MFLIPHAPAMPRSAARALCVMLTAALGGCVANSSNPTVSIRSARMNTMDATLALTIKNPSGRRLTVNQIDYELSHGEMGFPLSRSTWTGQLELPIRGEAQLPLTISFDSEPFEDDSSLLHLSGQLYLKDHTGFLDISSLDLTETPFQIDIEAERSDR